MRLLFSLSLALFLTLANVSCRTEVEQPKAIPQATAEIKPTAKFERNNLTVEARHSETAQIGDLAGLMVSIQNRSEIPVPGVRIRVSSGYFDGLEIRKSQPDALEVTSSGASKIFEFQGVKAGTKLAYLFLLSPVQVGEYAAEMEVSILDADNHEDLLAIYDLTTKVESPRLIERAQP